MRSWPLAVTGVAVQAVEFSVVDVNYMYFRHRLKFRGTLFVKNMASDFFDGFHGDPRSGVKS